jgi:hypothetical protein
MLSGTSIFPSPVSAAALSCFPLFDADDEMPTEPAPGDDTVLPPMEAPSEPVPAELPIQPRPADRLPEDFVLPLPDMAAESDLPAD